MVNPFFCAYINGLNLFALRGRSIKLAYMQNKTVAQGIIPGATVCFRW